MEMDEIRDKIKERRKKEVDKDDDLSFEAILIIIHEWHEMKKELGKKKDKKEKK